jgi:hypothetical protein
MSIEDPAVYRDGRDFDGVFTAVCLRGTAQCSPVALLAAGPQTDIPPHGPLPRYYSCFQQVQCRIRDVKYCAARQFIGTLHSLLLQVTMPCSLFVFRLSLDHYADSFTNESAYCYGRLCPSVCPCVRVCGRV